MLHAINTIDVPYSISQFCFVNAALKTLWPLLCQIYRVFRYIKEKYCNTNIDIFLEKFSDTDTDVIFKKVFRYFLSLLDMKVELLKICYFIINVGLWGAEMLLCMILGDCCAVLNLLAPSW